jgi:hypothetical protein
VAILLLSTIPAAIALLPALTKIALLYDAKYQGHLPVTIVKFIIRKHATYT